VERKTPGGEIRQLNVGGQIWCIGPVAIYAGRFGVEVIFIRIKPAHLLPSGVWYPQSEYYPRSDLWGLDGFSYTSNSHSDLWAAAFAKTIVLFDRQFPSNSAR
jgi:hypothetical protein